MQKNIREEVNSRLMEIESTEGVTIIYACESGSRAWGFASVDSDFDVRFIYIRPRDWYLSIDVERRRDVIEGQVDNVWDVNGWDLRKALQLLSKSNPPLLEWLKSPIIYKEHKELTAKLRNIAVNYYSAPACFYHYLHMAKGNYREYLQGELVRTKKYLYVLRPLLAIRWIDRFDKMVPMQFDDLVEAVVEDNGLRSAINKILKDKKAGAELGFGPRIPEINNFIENEFKRHNSKQSCLTLRKPKVNLDALNIFFRWALEVNEKGI